MDIHATGMYMRASIFIAIIYSLGVPIHIVARSVFMQTDTVCKRSYVCDVQGNCHPGNFIHQLGRDLVELNRNLVSRESMLVIAGLVPLYLVSRTFDEDCHSLFYDRNTHKNMCQIPYGLWAFEHYTFAPLLVSLCVLPRFSENERVRIVTDVFAKGILSIWGIKNIFKNGLGTKACLRPWNENFHRYNRSYGGFPSGHVAEAVYTAALLGIEYGPLVGIPLGIYTGLVFAVSVNSNRHYMSQVIAGAGIGLVYAFAAHKLIDKKLAHTIELAIVPDMCGRSNLSLSYSF